MVSLQPGSSLAKRNFSHLEGSSPSSYNGDSDRPKGSTLVKPIGRGAVFGGIIIALLAVVAAGIAWWRWERIETVAGDIPLPPGSQIVRRTYPAGTEEYGRPCTFVIRSRKRVESLKTFFRQTLSERAWEAVEESPRRMKQRKAGRILRIVFHQEINRTVFTLNIVPCRQR